MALKYPTKITKKPLDIISEFVYNVNSLRNGLNATVLACGV